MSEAAILKIKYLPWIIVAVLLILLAIGILTRPDPTDTNGYVKEYEAAISKRDDQIKAKTAQVDRLVIEVEKRDSMHAENERRLKTALNAKSKEVDRLLKNPIVIAVRESTPEIDSLITDLQYKIDFQSSYIQELDSAYTGLRVDFDKLKNNFDEQIKLYQENFEAQKLINESDRKQLRKVRRQLRVMKAVAILGTVGGIFLGSR